MNIDSLKSIVVKQTSPESNITNYYLAKAYKNSSRDSLAYTSFKHVISDLEKLPLGFRIDALAELARLEKDYKRNNEEAIKYLIHAFEYDNNSQKKEIAFVHSLLGQIYNELGVPKLALQEKLKEYELINKTEPQYHLLYYIAEYIGGLNLQLKDYDNALLYFKKSLQIAEETQQKFRVAHAYNNIGFSHYYLNQFDSSLVCYNKSLQIISELEQHNALRALLQASVKGNISSVLQKKNETKLVEEYSRENYETNKKYGDTLNQEEASLDLASALLYLKKYQHAKLFLDTITNEFQFESKLLMRHLLMLKFELSVALNDELAQNEFLIQIQKLDNEIIEQQKNNLMSVSEILVKYQIDRNKKDLELLKSNHERELVILESKRSKVVLVAFSLGLLVVLVFILYKRKVAAAQQEKEVALLKADVENEKAKNLELLVQNKNKDLTDFAIDISRKNEFAEELLGKLKDIKTVNEEQQKKQLKDLMLYVKGQLNVDNKFKEFQNNIDEVNRDFFMRLNTSHTDLNQNDLQLCGLLRLKLTNKDIALIKNISPKSAKMGRYRLKKKLGLEENDDIIQYLNNI